MSIKSFDFKPMSSSNPPSYSSYSRPPNPVNSYPSSSSSTSTWTSSNREWTVSAPMPNSSLSKYSSLPSLPNLQSSYPSSSSSTPTWTPSSRNWTTPPPMPNSSLSKYSSPSCPPSLTNSYPSSSSSAPTWTHSQREWTTSSPISGHGPSSNFSQLFTQANPYPQSSQTGSHFSPLQNRDFHNFSASQAPSLRGDDSSAVFQFLNMKPPQFSSKNSFDDFSFLHRVPSNGGLSSSHILRNFMDKKMSVSPTRFLPTMEDRAFQSFQKAMNVDRPFSCSSTTISFSPATVDRGSPTIDVTTARFSNGVPHISTAKITVLDTAVGIWNGTKQTFALFGLQQMEISGQEKMEILDSMAATDQARRAAFKEQMSSGASSELHPVSIAKNRVRLSISNEIHKIFQEFSSPFVELSKYRPNLTFEESSSNNFWDAPKENGHTAIDKFFQTRLAQRYLSDPQTIIIAVTKCEIPFSPGGNLSTLPKVASVGQKAIPGIAANRAVFEQYKVQLRMQMEKPHVVDLKLKEIVEWNYKFKGTIGNGSTAAAIRYERVTGKMVCGKFHSQKGKNTIVYLEKWLKNNPVASSGDRAAAENMIKDLIDALGK